MQIKHDFRKTMRPGFCLTALAALLLTACGGGDGPAIEARPQTVSFGAAPALSLGGTATVSATASSGLAVSYRSTTPTVCSVNGSTGVVTAIATGNCIIAANQPGNSTYAQASQVTQSIPVAFDPNQTISFGSAPALSLFGITTVSATANSGLAVSYSSTTPAICSVNTNTGVVTDIAAGDCIIAANQAGNIHYYAAPQMTLTLTVSAPSVTTKPGAPSRVTATAGNLPNTVTVSIGAIDSGGSAILSYTVTSTPTGITATAAALPITVTCGSTCNGYAFSVMATNTVGDGAPSAPVDVVTNYNVHETFREPDTQPRDSIFIGSFTFNSTTGTVSNLHGILSESMTGGLIAYPNDTMNWLTLNNQLSSVYDATLGGLLVTTFMLPATNTLSANPAYGGSNGWAPGSGMGLYYGYPGINPGNAYAMIFVNLADPTAAPTFTQIQALAYADCAAGGMMGSTCMTGYGGVGTMGGYPVSQTITRQ